MKTYPEQLNFYKSVQINFGEIKKFNVFLSIKKRGKNNYHDFLTIFIINLFSIN